jgi:hypothetical protein
MIKDLHYIFTCTVSPVQAEGLVNGKQFYFRSRHEHWSFAVSEDPNVDPIDIQSTEQGKIYGFFIEERYGDASFDAGYMPLDEAERIIENCVNIYLNELE